MAGPPQLVPALILGSLHYGETSRVVRLLTAEHGVVSAIAKGALRPKSRFGASLRLLSEGQAHLLLSPTRDLHLLTAFDLASPHAALARDLPRFLAATALAELIQRFVPAGANPGCYGLVREGLVALEEAKGGAAEETGLQLLWSVIGELGVAPSLDLCANDGAALPGQGRVAFALEDGGLLCAACALARRATTHLDPEDIAALRGFLAPGHPVSPMDPPHRSAHRRLLTRWVHFHLGEGELPALELWRRGGLGVQSLRPG